MTDPLDDPDITTPPPEKLKLITLSVSNVLGIELAEVAFDPQGGLVTIAGNNAQGKSSLLNAIWLALAGGAASRKISTPVKSGENFAYVQLELGDGDVDLRVVREWDLHKKSPTKLIVTRADGIPISRPQDLLDSLIGAYSFDPFAFAEANDPDRAAMYLAALGVDVSDLESELDRRFVERRQAKSARDDLEARVRALPPPDPALPEEENPNTELLDEYRAATERQGTVYRLKGDLATAENLIETSRHRIATYEAEIQRLQDNLAAEQRDLALNIEERDGVAVAYDLAQSAAATDDLDALGQRIAANDAMNADIREAAAYRELDAEYEKAVGHANDLEFLVEEVRGKIRRVISEATAPIEGLYYRDRIVYFGEQELPFAQASESDKLKVSLAFAMALNPGIRIIRCEGSRIDENGLRVIDEMTRERGYQVLMERVGIQPGASVIMEAGRVAATNTIPS